MTHPYVLLYSIYSPVVGTMMQQDNTLYVSSVAMHTAVIYHSYGLSLYECLWMKAYVCIPSICSQYLLPMYICTSNLFSRSPVAMYVQITFDSCPSVIAAYVSTSYYVSSLSFCTNYMASHTQLAIWCLVATLGNLLYIITLTHTYILD